MGKSMKKVSVWANKGGVGKTTMSLMLAGAASKRGQKVALWDFDPMGSATWIAQFGQLEFDVVNKEPVSGYDLVIADYPPNLQKVPFSELVIVPFQPSALDIGATKRFIPTLHKKGKEVISVINLVKSNRKGPEEFILDEIKKGALVIKDRSIYQRATGAAITIFSSSLDRKYGVREARIEINRLLDRVLS